MRLRLVITLLAALVALPPEGVLALDKRYPDWPCRQLKVPELSAAAVWPDATPGGTNAEALNTPELSELVSRLAARRTPAEEAEKLIAGYITGTPAEKEAKAKALFGRLLEALDAQRSSVMDGIERSYRKQKQLAEIIRANTIKLRELQDAGGSDEAKLQEMGRQIEWDMRIFEDRRRTTSFACEVPAAIEQRLFLLTKPIRKAIEG
jgi:hypothetical protein